MVEKTTLIEKKKSDLNIQKNQDRKNNKKTTTKTTSEEKVFFKLPKTTISSTKEENTHEIHLQTHKIYLNPKESLNSLKEMFRNPKICFFLFIYF